MFSRPERSWSKPAWRLSSVEMWPLTSTTPSDGWMMPASASSSVLLPAPLGPMTPTDSPRRTSKSTSRSAQKWPLCAAPVGAGSRRSCAASSCCVNWRLYWTPRSAARMATSPVGVGHVERELVGLGRPPARPPRSRASVCVVHHRTFANAGSSRLKTIVADDQQHDARSRRRPRGQAGRARSGSSSTSSPSGPCARPP